MLQFTIQTCSSWNRKIKEHIMACESHVHILQNKQMKIDNFLNGFLPLNN